MVTRPFVPTSTNAPNRNSSFSAPRALNSSTSPAEAAVVIFTNSRRFTLTTFMSHLLRGAMNRPPDAHVCAAATEIAAHGLVDLGIGRFFVLRQQARGAHDLARLAISALRHVLGEPGLLQRMSAVG